MNAPHSQRGDARRVTSRVFSRRGAALLACIGLLSAMHVKASVTIAPGAADSDGHWWYVTWINDGKDGGPGGYGGLFFWYAQGGWTPWGYMFTQHPECNGSAAGCFKAVIALHGHPIPMWQHDGDANKPMCFGKKQGSVFQPFEGGACVYTTPPKPVCQVTSPPPIAHSELDAANVNGNVSTVNVTISCTLATTVRVRAIASLGNAISRVPVRADGSIASQLQVNGIDGATGTSVVITAPYVPTTVTIKSTLAAASPAAGPLSGNAVLVIDVP
jgi:hypothetical protein